jgi:hypothetical protein
MNQNTPSSTDAAKKMIIDAYDNVMVNTRARLRSMPCDRAALKLLHLSFEGSTLPDKPLPDGDRLSNDYCNALSNADLAHALAVAQLTAEFLSCDMLGCDTLESADNNPTQFSFHAVKALRAILKHPLDHATACKSTAVAQAFRAMGDLTPRLTRQIDLFAYEQLPLFAREARQGRDILSKAKAARLTTSTGAMMI